MPPFPHKFFARRRAPKSNSRPRLNLRLEPLEPREVPAGQVALHAFHDQNQNGLWEPAEPGVGGATAAGYDYGHPDSFSLTAAADGTAATAVLGSMFMYSATAPAGYTAPGGGSSASGMFSLSGGTHTITLPLTAAAGGAATVWVTKVADSAEPSSPGLFRFHRSAIAGSLPVNYAVSGSASNSMDYMWLSGQVTFPAGATTVDVPVSPTDDTTVEGDETVTLTVSAGTAYTADPMAGGSATLTLADNDAAPGGPGTNVWVTKVADAAEPASAGLFRFHRSAGAGSLTVDYSLSGSAFNMMDYGWLSGQVSFLAGIDAVDVAVNPTDDAAVEGAETVTATISASPD